MRHLYCTVIQWCVVLSYRVYCIGVVVYCIGVVVYCMCLVYQYCGSESIVKKKALEHTIYIYIYIYIQEGYAHSADPH